MSSFRVLKDKAHFDTILTMAVMNADNAYLVHETDPSASRRYFNAVMTIYRHLMAISQEPKELAKALPDPYALRRTRLALVRTQIESTRQPVRRSNMEQIETNRVLFEIADELYPICLHQMMEMGVWIKAKDWQTSSRTIPTGETPA